MTDEQLPIYEDHLDHETDQSAEIRAIRYLGDYPITLNLSEEQKDIIYQNMYKYSHKETYRVAWDEVALFKAENDNIKWEKLDRNGRRMIWAAEEILKEEQMDILMKSLIRSK